MTARARAAAAAVLLLALALCGCSTLPTGGKVKSRPDSGAAAGSQAPYFAPAGPKPGDDRLGVVRGFLLAMQANPPSTAVARQFLSRGARSTWNPVDGTIVYDSSSVALDPNNDRVEARLSDAHRLDRRGAWDTGASLPNTPGQTVELEELREISFALVRENGEWRIDNPPDALAVPASYFPSLFVPFQLYFFDRTGTVLVPVRVYLPRGERTASNLVRGLLAGPPPSQAAALTSALPAQPDPDLGVLVSNAGVAEVPLGPGVLRLSPADLERLIAQLTWTLRQVPGVTRLRLTQDGLSVPLPNGQEDVSVRQGAAYDPVAAADSDLVGIAGGRVVRLDKDTATPIGGPLGRRGFSLRSVALDVDGQQVAAVAANGDRLYLAADRGNAPPRTPVVGTDLLRPAFDRFGLLWSIDRTAAGAVVHVTSQGEDVVVAVPGISGERLAAFTMTRDGNRLVAALGGGDVPRLVVASIVRDREGRFVRAVNSARVELTEAGQGRIRDVGQVGSTTLAVLVEPSGGPAHVIFTELDGSPGEPGASIPDLIPDTANSIVASPDPTLPLRAVTGDGHLLVLDASAQWVSTGLVDVRAMSYPD